MLLDNIYILVRLAIALRPEGRLPENEFASMLLVKYVSQLLLVQITRNAHGS
jgi:hypothetical protein